MHLEVLVTPDLAQNELLSAMQSLTDPRTPSPVLVPFTVSMFLLKKDCKASQDMGVRSGRGSMGVIP